MPGKIVDLSLQGSSIPDPIVVDTNIITDFLLASLFVSSAPNPKAGQFFQHLHIDGATGVVTPTAFREFIHAALRARYKHEFRLMTPYARRTTYGYPVRDWVDLYKQDASVLQGFLPDLRTLRNLRIANGLLLAAPEDLGPIVSDRSYDEKPIDLVGAYGKPGWRQRVNLLIRLERPKQHSEERQADDDDGQDQQHVAERLPERGEGAELPSHNEPAPPPCASAPG